MQIKCWHETAYHMHGGIMLLRMALENVYGQPLDALVKKYCRRFDMHATTLNVGKVDTVKFAMPHNERGEVMQPMLRSTSSIFTIKSTAHGMLEFVEANVREKDLGMQPL